ncbi:MAG: RNA polymerase sigma factor [Planctomycetota bacterium]
MDAIDIKKLRAADKEAVRQWFERYGDPLYTLVYYRLGGDGDTAADVVQETFLTALSGIEDYEPRRGSMFAWLSYLSRNCTKKALRERSRHMPHQAEDWQLDGRLSAALAKIAAEPLPQEALEQAETADLVRIAMGSIPANYASVLRKFYYEQIGIAEISTAQQISAGGVRVLLHRAREAFKEAFLNLVKFEEDGMGERDNG